MEIIVAIALIWGAGKALETGVHWAYSFAKAAGKARWQSYAQAHPRKVAPVGRVGQAVGRVTATGFHTAVAAGAGFGAGLKPGWVEGKQLAYERQAYRHGRRAVRRHASEPVEPLDMPDDRPARPVHDGRPEGTPIAIRPRRLDLPDRMPPRTAGSTALADPITDIPEDTKRMTVATDVLPQTLAEWDIDENEDGNGTFRIYLDENNDVKNSWQFEAASVEDAEAQAKTILRERGVAEGFLTACSTEQRELSLDVLQADPPETLASVTSITGGNDMSVTTVNGTDIQTFEQLLVFLGNVEQESVADMDDASADMERAKADAAGIEAMLASLHQLELDDTSLGEIGALGEDSRARLSAAQARLSASERRAAHAKAARDGVRSRHAAMQEARDSTPNGGAKREFYQH